MTLDTNALFKYGGVGLVIGAVLATIIGFTKAGWQTRISSKEITDAALLSTRAAICVAQFTKDPDYETNLKELEGTPSFERHKLIDQGGWNKMPGENRPSKTVSQACADGLEVLMEK